eukprot:3086525-Pleurochrysis_carterae.AAC.1
MGQPGPSQPEEMEPDPPISMDEAVEPDDTMEWAHAVRPKILFGEPDPAARAGPRRPTQFCDPLSPPPPRPLPLRRLPSPVQSRPVRQRTTSSEQAGSSRVTRLQSRARAAAGLPPATIEPLPATPAQNPTSAGKRRAPPAEPPAPASSPDVS